jgi:TolA-binding protein
MSADDRSHEPLDSVARSRRARLADDEQQLLHEQIEQDPLVALDYQLGRAIDQNAGDVEDAALLTTAIERVCAQRATGRRQLVIAGRAGERRRPRSLSRPGALIVAGLLLGTAVGAAAPHRNLLSTVRSWFDGSSNQSGGHQKLHAQASAGQRERRQDGLPSRDALEAQQPPEPPSLAPAIQGGALETPGQRSAPSPALAKPSLKSRPLSLASDLLKHATEARAQGNAEEALTLFRQLQRDFPASREALISRISAAKLLLQQGRAADAVKQYDAYLASGGILNEDALYGRARALEAAGRRADAKATWRDLLSNYPGSVYERSARQKLGE